MPHLTVKDLRWASAQIAADDIAPMLERDIRKAVQRLARYRRDRQRGRAVIAATAELLQVTS